MDSPGVVSNVVRMSETHDLDEQSAQFSQNVVRSMLDNFVAPELKKRGLDTDPASIDQYLVELQPGNADAIVRISEEAHLDLICERDEDGPHIVGIRPQEQAVHPDSGWVLLPAGGGWIRSALRLSQVQTPRSGSVGQSAAVSPCRDLQRSPPFGGARQSALGGGIDRSGSNASRGKHHPKSPRKARMAKAMDGPRKQSQGTR